MKQLKRENMSNGSLSYQLEKGQWGLFAVRFEGTNATGQTVSLADLGQVILRWNGIDLVNVDFEFLNLVSNLYGGVAEFSSTTGGAFKATAYITTGLWFDTQNIYDVGDEDKVEFVLQFQGAVSKISSGAVEILGKPRRGIMSYQHKILKKTVVSSGAGSVPDTIPVNNISQVYIKNPSALVNRVQIQKDGKVYVDGSVGAIQSYSDWIHLLETPSSIVAIELTESKDVREAIGGAVYYNFQFTGAGNLEVYYSKLEPVPEKIDISYARAF